MLGRSRDNAKRASSAPTVERAVVAAAGRERSMTVVGPGRPAEGSPAVLFFHGSNQTAGSARRFTGNAFDALAGRGAVVAYLDGHKRNWNDARISSNFAARKNGVDDVAFATAAIGFLARSHGIDSSRVYAVGFSAGGAMVIRLAHEIPTRLAGAAIISETQPAPENFMLTDAPPSALPVVLIHGTGDPVVPYEGGMASLWGFQPRGLGLSARQTAAYYAGRNGITQGPESRRLVVAAEPGKTWVERTDYRQDGRDPVTLYTVHGGGHVIPGPKRPPGSLADPPRTWSPRRSSPTSSTFRPEVRRHATPGSPSRRTGKHTSPIRVTRITTTLRAIRRNRPGHRRRPHRRLHLPQGHAPAVAAVGQTALGCGPTSTTRKTAPGS